MKKNGHDIVIERATGVTVAQPELYLPQLTPPPPPPPPKQGLSHAVRPATEPDTAESAPRTASPPDSPYLSSAHAEAGCSVIQRLRRSLSALLLSLPLLLGLAAAAQAQVVTVPMDWALKPAGVEKGDRFRLLFVTSTRRNGQSTDIADYNTFVQTRAKAGHAAITDAIGNQFKVVGSTASVDARDNTGTTGAGVPIHWLNGAKVADDYADFYDGSWDSSQFRTESGGTTHWDTVFTGSNTNGTKHSWALGSQLVRVGHTQGNSLNNGNSNNFNERSLYGLSPVFEAQPTLVSNTGQTGDDNNLGNLVNDYAQAFTTGSHVKGYTVNSVDVVFRKNDLDDLFRKNNPRLTVTIKNESNGIPGTTVGTLNLPASSPTFDSARTFTFRAPARGIQLSPSTTYFFVIDVDAARSTRDEARLMFVNSNDEDPGGAAGFSIANRLLIFAWYNNPPGWEKVSGDESSLQMSVNGELNPITDYVQMSNPTRRLAEFGNHEANGGARFVVEIGDGLTPKGYARTINYTVGGSAVPGDGKDYTIDGCTSSTCSVRLPANRHSAVITIYVNDDGIDEGDETITFTLKDGSGYTVNDAKKTTTVTIGDDDTRGLMFNRGWVFVDEGGGSRDYKLKLASQPTAAVTVNIASDNPDVTVSPTSLTFTPSGSNRWNAEQKVKVSAAQDSDAVNDEAILTFTTSGGDYGGANALSYERSISVKDDDPRTTTVVPQLPRISLEGGPDVTEGAAASFTVNADPAPTSSLTVSVEVFEPPGLDFVAASQERVRTVVLNAGATSANFTVPTVDDNTDEDDGYVQAFVNDGTGYTAGQGSAVRVLDNDDPIPGAFFRSTSSDAVEHGGTHNVRVELNYPAPSGGLTLRYSLSGTATAGSSNDYTIQNAGTVTVAARANTATIPVAINDDSLQENAETVILTLIGGSGYTVDSPSVHTLNIEDNDSTSASFSTASSSATEGDGTRTVTVNLNQAASTGGLTIGYTIAGTATAGSGNDFTIASSGSLSIAQGSSSANIAVAINNDSAEETAETVILTLTSGTGYTLGRTTTHTLTIADNDPPAPTGADLANLGGSTVPEGGDVGFNLIFPRNTRNVRPGDPPLTLPLTIGGTATLGTDYRLSCATEYLGIAITCSGLNGNNPTITFDGSRLQSPSPRRVEALYLETLEDNTAESNETVKLTVGGGKTYTLTIKDAPSSVSVSFTRTSYKVSEGGHIAELVVLVTPVTGRELTIPLILTDVTTVAGEDYTSVSQMVIKANGKTEQLFDIPILDDTVYEGDETFTIAIDKANLPAGVTAGATTSAPVTIEDDDPAPNSPQLVLSRSSLTVAEGSTGSYTLKLATQPTGTVTVNIASGNNDITVSPSPVTFQSTGSSKLWNVAQTITVTAAQDVDATDDSGTLTHTASGGGYGSVTGSVSVTVNDDDNTAQPSASFASATSTAAESAGTRNVRVNLSSAAPSGGLTLNYSVGGTATAGSGNDFTIQGSGTLSVTAGSNTANIPVAINDDSTEESDETVILTLTGRTGYTLGSTTVHTLTITDNDTPTNACVSPSLLADVKGYAGENRPNSPDHVPRWRRVLAAFGESNDYSNNPMTLAEAQAQADRGLQRWVPVVTALECLAGPTPPDAPVISISAGGGITEGGTAQFTLTADPAPASNITVAVQVKRIQISGPSGQTGSQTVTIGTSGTADLSVDTTDDSNDWPNGTVYVAVQESTGYTVAAAPDNAASVSVADNDDTPGAPTLSVSDATVRERDRNCISNLYTCMEFTVRLNRALNQGERVDFTYETRESDPVSAKSTGSDRDFAPVEGQRVFRPGESLTRTIQVHIYDDCRTEGSETFDFVITYAGGANIADDTGVGTITDGPGCVLGFPSTGFSGEVGSADPGLRGGLDPDLQNRAITAGEPGGFTPDLSAGACVSPGLLSDASGYANQTWHGPAHVERWLRVMQTFSGSASDATIVTPAEAQHYAIGGAEAWLPVAGALRCLEANSLRQALER